MKRRMSVLRNNSTISASKLRSCSIELTAKESRRRKMSILRNGSAFSALKLKTATGEIAAEKEER
jgi:hypothetical protein